MNMMKRIKNTMSPPTIRKRIGPRAYLVLALMMLMACGGGGGSGGGGGGIGDLLAGGGIGGSGISIGTISGFGSVIVNDVHFNTEDAEVFVNGDYMGEGDSKVRSNLAIGMVVRVEGKHYPDGTSKAERIVFSSNLKGPVQSITPIDSVVNVITLLDQTVIVDDQTEFKNTTSKKIAVNNVLEVSGWLGVDGQILGLRRPQGLRPPGPQR